jgi:hypothetical protein
MGCICIPVSGNPWQSSWCIRKAPGCGRRLRMRTGREKVSPPCLYITFAGRDSVPPKYINNSTTIPHKPSTMFLSIFHPTPLLYEEFNGPSAGALPGNRGVSWVTKIYYLEFLRASQGTLQSLVLINLHWARVVGNDTFSLCVIYWEGLCPSSGI